MYIILYQSTLATEANNIRHQKKLIISPKQSNLRNLMISVDYKIFMKVINFKTAC